MVRRLTRHILVLSAMVAPACTRGEARRHPVAKIDTLPHGRAQVLSREPTAWADSNGAWKVPELQRYGGADGSPGELASPGRLALDAQGRVYVADQKPAVIKVFAPNGAFPRTIGRESPGRSGWPGTIRLERLSTCSTRLAPGSARSSSRMQSPRLGPSSGASPKCCSSAKPMAVARSSAASNLPLGNPC